MTKKTISLFSFFVISILILSITGIALFGLVKATTETVTIINESPYGQVRFQDFTLGLNEIIPVSSTVEYYPNLNDNLQFTPLPNNGYTFEDWIITGMGTFTANPLTFTASGSFTITVQFQAIPQSTSNPPTTSPPPTITPPPTNENGYPEGFNYILTNTYNEQYTIDDLYDLNQFTPSQITSLNIQYELLDGVTDAIINSSYTFSYVINYLNNVLSSGNTVFVMPNLYFVNNALILDKTSEFSLVGGGTAYTNDGVTFFAYPDLNQPVLIVGEPDFPVNNVTIYNIGVYGNGLNQNWYDNVEGNGADYTPIGTNNIAIDYENTLGNPDGICVCGSYDSVSYCNVQSCKVFGIALFTAYYVPTNNTNIGECIINECGWNCITSGISNSYILYNTISNCCDVGISLQGQYQTVEFNTVYNIAGNVYIHGSENSGWGIASEGLYASYYGNFGQFNNIYDNTIYNCVYGVVVNTGNTSVTDNTIYANSNFINVLPFGGDFGYGGTLNSATLPISGMTVGITVSFGDNFIVGNSISDMISNYTTWFYSPMGYGIWILTDNSTWFLYNTIIGCQNYAFNFDSVNGYSANENIYYNIGDITTWLPSPQRGNEMYDDNYPLDNNIYFDNSYLDLTQQHSPTPTSTPTPKSINIDPFLFIYQYLEQHISNTELAIIIYAISIIGIIIAFFFLHNNNVPFAVALGLILATIICNIDNLLGNYTLPIDALLVISIIVVIIFMDRGREVTS